MASKRLSQEEIANQKAERIMNGVATWCSYYRANPHRFCKDYLGLNLKLFQKILIFMMNISDAFMFIAARALAKHILQRFIVVCVPFYIPAQLFVLPRALAHRQLECLRK